jgi:hypothetical protein
VDAIFRGLIYGTIGHLSGGSKEDHENLRIAGVRAKI